MSDTLHIIDFEKKGNLVRFYLGYADDYSGDDWNDAPYDCNADRVYDQFIKGYIDICFPFTSLLLEPKDGPLNCRYSKDDMKDRQVPCLIYVPEALADEYGWFDYETNFYYWLAHDGVEYFYYGDPADRLLGGAYTVVKEGKEINHE